MYESKPLQGGGFNFGVINKKSSTLDGVKVNSILSKRIVPIDELVYKEESGYGVYICEEADKDEDDFDTFNIAGVFALRPIVGQTYEISGKVTVYRDERQLFVDFIKPAQPTNRRGIIAFLQTLKGLNHKADDIFSCFGEQSIEVLKNDPLLISKEVPGIGEKSVLQWQDQLKKMEVDQHALTTLLGFGIKERQAKKILEENEGLIYKIEKNPYVLSELVEGYGFTRCDEIALNLGYDPQGMFRIEECLIHVLKEASHQGHCYLPKSELIEQTKALLSLKLNTNEMRSLLKQYKGKAEFKYAFGKFIYTVKYEELKQQYDRYLAEPNKQKKEDLRFAVLPMTNELVLPEIKNLVEFNRIWEEGNKCYISSMYFAEEQVAKRVTSLVRAEGNHFANAEQDLENYLNEKSIELETKQKEAVLAFSKYQGGFHILNGSAGCGKTFTLNIILDILTLQYKKEGRPFTVQVLAPTGKAAKIAAKATKRNAQTVHRGLKYKPNSGFEHNQNNPIDGDCVVVDESSMLDILLTKDLLNAISDGTKVIFLGDTKQLPSVGAGNVLQDLIRSGVIPMITLNVVKRQDKESGIIRNANRIIRGEMISSCLDSQDAYVYRKETPIEAIQTVLKSIRETMRVKGLSSEDIQVLCPQKSTVIGTNSLNYIIQQEFNPEITGEFKVLNKKVKTLNLRTGNEEMVPLYFRVGDKVIHIKNNYSKLWYFKSTHLGYQEDYETVGITNGECGVIEDIISEDYFDSKRMRIIVRYDDRFVFYENDFSELDHSSCLSLHKSQGSQWKAVIIPIMNLNYGMLENNLLYTGYTRAQAFSVVIGQRDAIEHAIRNQRSQKRYTGLVERLRDFAEVA